MVYVPFAFLVYLIGPLKEGIKQSLPDFALSLRLVS